MSSTGTIMVEKILTYMDKPSDFVVFTEDRKGHDRRYALNCDKLRSEVGWSPEASFDETIKSTVDWYKQYKK